MAKPQKKIVKKAGKAKAKKKWCALVAPKSFDNTGLGESYVSDSQLLMGKNITINLMHLTNDMRNQGIEISFVITKVHEGNGIASVIGYEVLPSQMKRVVRRGRSKVIDSFIVRVGKEQLVRIKPMAFTANRASRGAQTAIRLTVRERIKQLLKETTFDQLVQDLIQHKLQRTLKEVASAHHPIKSVEVKACILLSQKATAATPDIQETEEDKKEQVTEDVAPEEAADVKEETKDKPEEKETPKEDTPEEKKEAESEEKPSTDEKPKKEAAPEPEPAPEEKK
ncbi:hypothetical protein GOV07_04250 [Candidatus Woesearchaeota archaeon]|nr:hypothetical protein [Candidatus Woesearchaeota archaeon]